MEHCPDKHELSVPSNEVMVGDIPGNQHAHGHPNHVIEFEDSNLAFVDATPINNAELNHR